MIALSESGQRIGTGGELVAVAGQESAAEPALNSGVGLIPLGVPYSRTGIDDKGRPYTRICSFERVESKKYSVFRVLRVDQDTGREYDERVPEYFELGPGRRRIENIEDYIKNYDKGL